ncbi:MAG: GFA family protein, partial [Hyphomicrobiales bacterium]
VFEQIDGKTSRHFNDLGTQQVKNIDKPVHVYGDFARVMQKKEEEKRHRPLLDHVDDEKPPVTGGCLCGNIRYEIINPPIDVGYCHCKMCQRFTGAPMIAGSTFAKDSVLFTKGKVKFYQSSPIAKRGFCDSCGSSMVYQPISRRWTDWIFLFAGTLDNADEFVPEWHLGVESHVPWLKYNDELPKVRCEDSPGIVEAYEEAEKFSE